MIVYVLLYQGPDNTFCRGVFEHHAVAQAKLEDIVHVEFSNAGGLTVNPHVDEWEDHEQSIWIEECEII